MDKSQRITLKTEELDKNDNERKSFLSFWKKKKKNRKRSYFKNHPKLTKYVLIPLFVLLVVVITLISLQLFGIYRTGKELVASANNMKTAIYSRDLVIIEKNLSEVDSNMTAFSVAYSRIAWLKYFPYFGKYIEDGSFAVSAATTGVESGFKLINIVKPYSSIVGLGGVDTPDTSNAQERLDFVVNTFPELLPKIDELSSDMEVIKSDLNQINSLDYPEELFGYKVRTKVAQMHEIADFLANFLVDGKPLIESMPFMLGLDAPRTYMIIFQNDKELRPTGGFMTAYTLAQIDRGKFTPLDSSDIYDLDDKYTPTIQAPDPIIDYIRGPYVASPNLRLRDMNWNPDFSQSMNLFTKEAEKAGIEDIDGIIAVDTQVLVKLMNVLGVVEVPGFGSFSTEIVPECNCPQVIYELESFADVEGPIVWSENNPGEIVYAPENYQDRKGIIGPLMNSVMSGVLGQGIDKVPDLFEAAYSSFFEKHILVYMFDTKAQSAVENFGIAGTIVDYENDYLHINDANLGGRKSNLYMTQEVYQAINVSESNKATKTLIITYKNPEPQDGWLNSILPNWVRVYVPLGSQLIETSGLEVKDEPYEESGKTVFSGYFELRPQGVSQVTIKYALPGVYTNNYKLYIQKQPGKNESLYVFDINGKETEQFLNVDTELVFSLNK